jgi:hypothetical protein
MAAKERKKKPYTAPTLRPVSKAEAERIAARAGEDLSALGEPYRQPAGEPVATVRIAIVTVEGDADAATMGALGELLGKLLR